MKFSPSQRCSCFNINYQKSSRSHEESINKNTGDSWRPGITSPSGQTCPFTPHWQHQSPNTIHNTPAARSMCMDCFSLVQHRGPLVRLLPTQIRQSGLHGDENRNLGSSAQGPSSAPKQTAGLPQTSLLLSLSKERNTCNNS